uniref:SKP1 component POZ domain-containing protein n=1 Tax=Solanum lycopersicum TaxID=4081 RepID=A0A3Q7GR01_SOLLC
MEHESNPLSKMIILRSFDGETFEVDDEEYANTVIPLHNVTSKILNKVIEYYKLHVEVPKAKDKTAKEDLKSFGAEFVKLD